MTFVSNTRISNLVNTQAPFFIRNDHQNFIRFLEAYYEYLEQENNLLDILKKSSSNLDIDTTIDAFVEKFYDNFLNLIPKETIADRSLILKHVKDFYRARGTEKSINFLLNIIFDLDKKAAFYYPKKDILKASDGKWFLEKALRVGQFKINGISNNSIAIGNFFNNKTITGNSSGATATVERYSVYYRSGVLVNELKISGQSKNFENTEEIYTVFEENGSLNTISANIFGGVIARVEILNGGANYEIGDEVTIESNTGSGGIIKVSGVTTGNILSIPVINGGAGFQVNNQILITGGGGTGAQAIVSEVDLTETYHPKEYQLISTIIQLEANTQLGNSVYSNLNNTNVNSQIQNGVNFFAYSNTGPITLTLVTSPGRDYIGAPMIGVQSNTIVRNLGILGRLEIVEPGENYNVNDAIIFTNVIGGFGSGASAKVTEVDVNGGISEVKFVEIPGQIIGGSGYEQDKLPIVSVVSNTGSNAIIQATAILGAGETLNIVSQTIGTITDLQIVDQGLGYLQDDIHLNLENIGNGEAEAQAFVIEGAFTYPGRYLNDDGHLSSYNFLQNRDYYQNFSYVVRVKESIENYRKYIKDLVHPSGTKLFGEYLFENVTNNSGFTSVKTEKILTYVGNYIAIGNGNTSNIIINTTRNISNTEISYLEFLTGNTINIANGIYKTENNGNFQLLTNIANSVNTSGTVRYSI